MTRRTRGTLVPTLLLGALLAGCAGDTDAAPAPTAAAPVAPPSTSTAPAGPVAWVDALPIGPPPAVGYAIGHTYHSPDGGIVRLPHAFGITSVARLGDGYVVTSDHAFEGSTGCYQLDRRGRIDLAAGQRGHVPGAATVAAHPVLGAHGTTLHWLTFTPPESGLALPTLLHTGEVATGEVTTVEVGIDASFLTSVAGVIDDRAVIRDGWGGQANAWLHRDPAGLTRAPALDDAALISPRTRLVALRLGDDFSAGGVLDFDTRERLWRRPHTYPVAFSPSGRRLLAFDGNRLTVLDARTGEVRHEVAPPPYRQKQWYAGQLSWEDERHLLASVVVRDRAAVVRIDVATGATELAVDWTPMQDAFYVAFETTY